MSTAKRNGWVTRLVGLAIGLSVAATPEGAFAGTRIAVLGVEPVDAPVSVAARFSAALKEHVKRTGGYELVPGKAIEEVKLVFGCAKESPSCMAKVGESLKAELLFWGTLTKQGNSHALRLVLLRVANQSIERQLVQDFGPRQLQDPELHVLKLAQRILPAKLGRLKLSCAVEGAEVFVDGKAVGVIATGELQLSGLSVGPHTLRVSKSGFTTWFHKLTVGAGEEAKLLATLVAEGATSDRAGVGRDGDRRRHRGTESRLGWTVAFYSAVVATVGVAVGLAINGMQVLSLEDQKADLMRSLADPREPTNDKLYGPDACDAIAGVPRYAAVADVCSSGSSRATVQNVLIVALAATTGLSVYFGYRAFFATESQQSLAPTAAGDASAARPTKVTRWSLQPTTGVGNAGFGMRLRF